MYHTLFFLSFSRYFPAAPLADMPYDVTEPHTHYDLDIAELTCLLPPIETVAASSSSSTQHAQELSEASYIRLAQLTERQIIPDYTVYCSEETFQKFVAKYWPYYSASSHQTC